MNILHINTYDRGGGAEQFAIDIAKFQGNSKLLVKEKYSQEVFVDSFERNLFDKLFTFFDKVLWKLGVKKSFKKVFFIGEEFNQTYKKLLNNPDYIKADIIHLHNLHGVYFDLDAVSQIAKEKKIIWTLHDMWLLTGGESHIFEDVGYQKGVGKISLMGIPPIESYWIDCRQHYLEKKKALLELAGNNITLVPVSKWLEDCVRKSYVFNKQVNIHTIVNGCDLNIFFNRDKRTWVVPRILFFNSKSPLKGSSTFLNIISELHFTCEIYCVGDSLITDNANVNVVQLNHLEKRDELANLFNNIDILIFPSWAENFPLTVLEAMACGVHVVASNIGGIPEIINNNTLGTLFACKDQVDLSIKLSSILENIEHSRQIGRNGADHIISNFNLDITCYRYMKLYSELV